MSYKELHVAEVEGVGGPPVFKVIGVGAGITEFVHALRMELQSAGEIHHIAVRDNPYPLMTYCLDWIVKVDALKLFDWKIVYVTREGGFLQLSYCRPGFVESEPDENVYATRFERILQNETLV